MPSSTTDPRRDGQFLVSTSPPSRDQKRLAAWVLLILLVALTATAPFARVPLTGTEGLLPAYAAAMFVNEMLTAALLLVLYAIQPSRAILALSIGYLFSALLVIPWALTFPGVFAATGLLDAGLQSTASIAAVRRVGFPLFVLAYALLKDAAPAGGNTGGSVWVTICGGVIAAIAAVAGLTWLVVASGDSLPAFMADRMQVSAPWQYVSGTALLLYILTLTLLWIRRRSVLDLWLMIVLCTLLIEVILLSYLSAGRLSLGWWAGRLYGLASASVVLLVLISETATLYARLVRSTSAERRAREARLTTMEALSASIAHEVNQPLASMVTNADAGLRWLDRPNPELDEVRAALRRVVSDGHRAGKVIEGVRTMFKKSAQDRAAQNINELIQEVLRRVQDEFQLDRVSVHTELAADLPPVDGNAIQLQQVISNLVTNAIDALRAVSDRPRVLRVRSELRSGSILVSVDDSGPGLDPSDKERIFEPFFTTKPDGMGMGLMFCRSIVEAHGGRLWAVDGAPYGAVFQFTLPANDAAMVPEPGRAG